MSGPKTPGKALEAKMAEHDLSGEAVAKAVNVDRMRISRIRRDRLPVTPQTAALLGRLFSTGTLYWLHLQAAQDAADAEKALADELGAIVPVPLIPRGAKG